MYFYLAEGKAVGAQLPSGEWAAELPFWTRATTGAEEAKGEIPSFSVVSYNVLCDAERLGRGSNHDYASINVRLWPFRCHNIVEQVNRLNPSVVCLQEVSPAMYGDLSHAFADKGYHGTYVKKILPSWQPSFQFGETLGNAIFIRAQADTRVIAVGSRYFANDSESMHQLLNSKELLESAQKRADNAQFVVVEVAGGAGRVLVANTHLYWEWREPEVRVKQAQGQLYKRYVEEWAATHSCDALIACGDYNTEPSDPLYDYLAKEGVTEVPWQGAYVSALGRQPPITTKTATYHGVIDHIFYRKRRLAATTGTTMRVGAVSWMPSWGEGTLEELAALPAAPNVTNPSDHFMIGANFTFKGA